MRRRHDRRTNRRPTAGRWITGCGRPSALATRLLVVLVVRRRLLFPEFAQEVRVVVRGDRALPGTRTDPFGTEQPPQNNGNGDGADRREQIQHARSFPWAD